MFLRDGRLGIFYSGCFAIILGWLGFSAVADEALGMTMVIGMGFTR